MESKLGNSGCMNNIVPVMVLLCMMKLTHSHCSGVTLTHMETVNE